MFDGGTSPFGASAPRADWAGMEEDYSLIRRHIEHVIPGFDSYEARIDHPGGFVLPHPPRDSRSFKTASGKAVFTANELEYPTVPAGRLLLQTIRTSPPPRAVRPPTIRRRTCWCRWIPWWMRAGRRPQRRWSCGWKPSSDHAVHLWRQLLERQKESLESTESRVWSGCGFFVSGHVKRIRPRGPFPWVNASP
jgi:hypothetical protein